MYGLKQDWIPEPHARQLVCEDYERGVPRWCPGCGDFAVLNTLQKLATEEQLLPEKTVVVSGIGCSSRLPHYVKTYGFHGLHGRPLPIASGIRARRPDLHIFVVTGDGDCCAIGAGHWLHAVRYNMKMTVLLLDNHIYGLTKKQTSPTTGKGYGSNTHPDGALLSPLKPLAVTLGITNASFVAQTVDWNPGHLLATLTEAHRHPGLAFVRIMQRCPHFTPDAHEHFQRDPSNVLLLTHPDGIPVDEVVARVFQNQTEHDPADRAEALALADREDVLPIGLFLRNPAAERYDLQTAVGIGMSAEQKLTAIQAAVDRFRI